MLPAIDVPTLVLHRPGFPDPPPEVVAYVAAQISDATLVALPGRDHPPYIGDVDAIVDEVEAFLSGGRHGASLDRILSTVLFTDIVGSTQRLAELGDARWSISSPNMTALGAGRSNGTGAAMSTRPGTAYLRPSTGPPGRSAAPKPWPQPSASSAWTSAPGATPARLNSPVTKFAA